MVYGCNHSRYVSNIYGQWVHIFARAVSYGLLMHIFLELSNMVQGCTFLIQLSHKVYRCTRAVSYGLLMHIFLELSHMVYGCTFC